MVQTRTGNNGNNTITASITDRWWPLSNIWESWIIYGRAGNDLLTGGPRNDTLYGEQDNDYLYGKDGNDKLYGGTGSDYLAGENGDDTLTGFGGGFYENDTLVGGAGADRFILGDQTGAFYVNVGGGESYAIITDFNYRQDKFQVFGSASDYSLIPGNWSGSSALDTGIYYQGDLIGVVQDKSGNDVLLPDDFIFV